MSNSRIVGFRAGERMRSQIDARRGDASISTWVREACTRRLEAEQGLGPEIRDDLAAHAAQLRGLGTNLNQLARAANEGRPVIVNQELLTSILDEIRRTKSVLVDLRQRLPE